MRSTLAFFILLAWLGIHLSCGYVVAPVLFSALDKMTAGNIAGTLFHIVAYVGIFACVALYLLTIKEQHVQAAYRPLLALALFWVLINEFMVTPVIVALKTAGNHFLLTQFGGSFALWHGISSSIYLLCSILGLCIAWLWVGRRNTQQKAA